MWATPPLTLRKLISESLGSAEAATEDATLEFSFNYVHCPRKDGRADEASPRDEE
jgi:hypothetical protein